MKTVLLLKNIYLEGIKVISNIVIRNYLKLFTWFIVVLLMVVVHSFLYRIYWIYL
ncbi:DUF6747 family protein [Zobellia alginiliquefaciens]|uniref:DUF6747 family protein n=1 Tax=Zobellia alginiliquefaciens TaxID=3032586 RepID=UPI0032C3F3F3